MKNMLLINSITLCHITNDDTGLFDINEINKQVQGSAGNMSTNKKGKVHVNICQVEGTQWVHTIWPVKFCPN